MALIDLGLYVYVGTALLKIVIDWKSTTTFFGHLPFGFLSRSLLFATRSRGAWRLVLAVVFGALSLIIYFNNFGFEFSPTPWTAATATTCLLVLSRFALPPAVLVLTGSNTQGFSLLNKVHRAIWPLRVVALLDYSTWAGYGQDNLRTNSPHVWRSIVHQLIDIAPIIIVDTRAQSASVEDESFVMLAPERVGKAAFISELDGNCPTLSKHGIRPRDHALPAYTEHELISRLPRLIRSAEGLTFGRSDSLRHIAGNSIIQEGLETIPSRLIYGIVDSFSSKEMYLLAAQSGKDLLVVDFPGPGIEDATARQLRDLTWEFLHDQNLVLLEWEPGTLAVVRIAFLRKVLSALPNHAAAYPSRLSIEKLFESDPVRNALWETFADLRQAADKLGYTRRLLRR